MICIQVLNGGELMEHHAYVGATVTLFSVSGGTCNVVGETKSIVAFDGTSLTATVDQPFSAVPGADCEYTITNSTTVVYLDDTGSNNAGHYDQHLIRFLTGACIDRWTTITSYSGNTIHPTRAMLLGAKTTPWISGNVLSQSSASTFTLGFPAVNTSANYRGMWITVRNSLGASMGQSKIANFSAYPSGTLLNSGTATVIPPLSHAFGAASYVIHGWDDGGRPCENYGWGQIELISPNCDRVVDEGDFTSTTSSVVGVQVPTPGANYTATGGAFTATGGGGSGVAGYCKATTTPGAVTGDVVITNGGAGYSTCPTIECPGHNSATTDHVITCTLGASGVTLGSTASLTANAYTGYVLSIDGSGERHRIKTYSSARVATVVQPFTDAPPAPGTGRYTVRGCTGEAGAMVCTNCPRIVRADVVDNGDSSYSATFTGTRKGQYSVVTSLVNAGGVAATYYDSLENTVTNDFGAGNPVSSSVISPTVDWSAATTTSTPDASLTNRSFGVRWVGFVRPSRAQQYTFHMLMPQSDSASPHIERVKLWVDNSIVIQQWSSLAASAPSGE